MVKREWKLQQTLRGVEDSVALQDECKSVDTVFSRTTAADI